MRAGREHTSGCRCGGAGLGFNGYHYEGAVGCRIQPPKPIIHDRDRLTARLTYLAVGLTDAGLSALVERAETLTVDHARPLTSGALAKAQQEREAETVEQAAPMAGKVFVPERGGL